MSLNIVTKITQQKEEGLGKCWQGWQRGREGVREMLTMADKGGRESLDPPIFGWRIMWTAHFTCFGCFASNNYYNLLHFVEEKPSNLY